MPIHTTIRSEDFLLGEVILSYPTLFEPQPIVKGTPKYSVALIMNRDVTRELYNQCQAIAAEAFPGGESNDPRFLWPFSPVESKTNQPHYAELFPGHYVTNPKSGDRYPPKVIGADRKPVIDKSLIFPGAKAYVLCNLYSFSEGQNTGIGIGFSVVMVWGAGEPFDESSGVNVEAAFAGVNVTPVTPQTMQPMSVQQQPVQQQPMSVQQQPMPVQQHQSPMGQQQSMPVLPGQGTPVQQPVQQQQPAVDPITGQPIRMPDFTG